MADSTANPLVRFVVAPCLPAHQPALGVSSLLAVLREQGIPGDVQYLNLDYGERIGWDLYQFVTVNLPSSLLAGEMLFTRALWGESAPEFSYFEDRVTRWLKRQPNRHHAVLEAQLSEWGTNSQKMRAAIEKAPQLISEWADVVLAGAPRVLGFTSTFQQSAAALALAREVRRRVPAEEVAIIFGGANCEDEMGRAMADNFDFIDCVVSGEAEEIIVDLVRKLMAEGGEERPPRFIQGPMVTNMDVLPIPEFEDYFAAAQRPEYCGITVRLAAESSRGCWWGLKSHCTFCGLNGGTMSFRGKSAARFSSELETLSQKYGLNRFALTDNILDMSYLRTLFPDLTAHGSKYRLFYETKSNLRKDHVELLAAAGVYLLQPGIESFSTSILKLMGKGTTRLQNIQLLKWCAELGVAVMWNLLIGFPGEDPEEYRQMAGLLPSLYHFAPPSGYSKVRLDRFGPYWKWPERHGIINVRHTWTYDLLFAGLPEQERERLAYFFDYEYADGRQPSTYVLECADCVDEWRKKDGESIRLELKVSASGASVIDTRSCRRDEVYKLTSQGLALVRALDGIRSRDCLLDAVRDQGEDIQESELESLLAELLDRRFIIEENGSYLALIVDPEQRARVTERQVALRLNRFGFRWPDDFPDPAKQQVVRAAMLALGTKNAPAPVA
ncbi:MAG: RiPP maturation radical SAM C-methyltransferase [Thermoanaerobaculia bacterium]